VAPGKAITSPRGVLGPLAEVRDRDFPSATLEILVSKGFVIRNGTA